ncbi:MAG: hypothetical protein ABI969_04715 [bacterium]
MPGPWLLSRQLEVGNISKTFAVCGAEPTFALEELLDVHNLISASPMRGSLT